MARVLALGLALSGAGLTGGLFPAALRRPVGRSRRPGRSRQPCAASRSQQIDAPNGTPEARLGVEVRNALIFGLTGGGRADLADPPAEDQAAAPTASTSSSTSPPRGRTSEIYGIDATYTLTELATNKVVLTGRTFSRVSYDIPGQQQRFAASAACATPRTAPPT